jgi:hypothetical protein
MESRSNFSIHFYAFVKENKKNTGQNHGGNSQNVLTKYRDRALYFHRIKLRHRDLF